MNTSSAMENCAKVSSLFVYPIKSCRGISVSQAPLTPTGFRWDRNWLVVNSKLRAYTQRNEPKLALVQVELPQDAFSQDWKPTENSYMVIKAPGMDPLKISLCQPAESVDGVSMFEWTGSALDEGEEARKWFTDYLEKPSRLVRFKIGSECRPVDPEYALGYSTTFADLFPFLLLSKGSLDALNKLLKEPVPVNRFRPNIFVDGCESFAEDLWEEIKIKDSSFQGVKLCNRCKIPTINQDTGIAGSEPNETLKTFRSDKALGTKKKHQGKIYFGKNMIWKSNQSDGTNAVIKVGDAISVSATISSAADAAV